MANEHIARKQAMGLGKESTAGTAVSASAWIPKASGVLLPISEKAKDDSAYGVIDEIYDSVTTKNMTEVTLGGILRDDWFGHILLAAFGSVTKTLEGTLGSVVGTFTIGETVTGGTSSATGTVKRKEGTTIMYVTPVTGTFTSGETITGGTSSATATFTYDSAIRAHIFERNNTNNHQSYTLYMKDDIGVVRAPYCLLDELKIDVAVGDFARFDTKWMGKKMESSSGTPAYSSDNNFLASHADLYMASTIAGLTGASATPVSRFSMTISKNLVDYQAFGDTDIASIHNRQFNVAGDLEALYNAVTLRDYMIDSTKRAMRLKLINTDVTIGSAGNPALTLEMARSSFESWTNATGNNDLVRQTMGFQGEYDNDNSYTALAILRNDNTTGY